MDALGVPPGAAVASVFHNCGLAALLFLSVIATRRLYVPLNPASSPSELDDMLRRSDSQVVFLDPAHSRSNHFPGLTAVRIQDHRQYFLERCRCAPVSDPPPVAENDATFVGEIVFTSGSTGRPKGVVLSERNLLANAAALVDAYQMTPEDRFLSVCPLFHNSGQILTTLACALTGGSTAAIKSDVGMLHFWHYLNKHRAHWCLVMTSFLALLLARKDSPAGWHAMRGLLTGGSAIDAGLIRQFECRFGIPVRTVFGLTESSSIATCEQLDPEPRALGSSGRALACSDVRIGNEAAPLYTWDQPGARERGEIWIGGPTIFDHYVGDAELTRFRIRDGWLRTGDLGYFDSTGNLFVVDRLDSMLIVGGENVYPAEVEKLCALLPGAAQIVVVGVDHPIWGKELILVYKATEESPPPLKAWHQVFTDELAAFKIPQRYVGLPQLGLTDFPRKENGKLDRQRITALVRDSK
jgi:acyl-CoA synthetase (AMP-forming)/AMP-acid ligase II